MKTLIMTVVLCLVLSVNAGAVDLETTAGTKHVLFNLQGLSNLGVDEFDGGFGLRWFVKDGLAVRTSIDYSRWEATVDPRDNDGIAYTDGESIMDSFEVRLLLEKRLAEYGPLSSYWGVGGGFGGGSLSQRSPVPVETVVGTRLQRDSDHSSCRC